MTAEEIQLRRLAGQHLTAPADTRTVVRDLCGVQAQFLSHALHGLSIRCGEADTGHLIKSWTLRGTMHLFDEGDLPLFLHEGRSHFLRPVDTLEADAYLTKERKAYFAALITDAVGEGIDRREGLKARCEAAGMTESEAKSLFDPWGGTIRALCESGQLCHKVQEQKAYRLCPAFEPMAEDAAMEELARRYFTHFGPATVKDAAYFFGTTQTKIKKLLARLPVENTGWDGKTYFYIPSGAAVPAEFPRCLFLAGFDQLMLGYEKTESLCLPRAHLREVFTLAGIVRPVVLVDGRAVGWWNQKNRRLKITLFDTEAPRPITDAAQALWPDLKTIEFA